MEIALPPQTDIVRDARGTVRRISHTRSPYEPAGFVPASATSLANWYLQGVGTLFGLEPDWLSGQPAAEGDAYDAAEGHHLSLAEAKAGRDMLVVSYSQAYARLPVFLAGVSVKMRKDLSAVLGAQSTLHLDIDLGVRPSRSSKEDLATFTPDRLHELLGLGPDAKRPEIEAIRWVIYRYLPEARFDPTTYEGDQPPSSPRLNLPEVPGAIVPGRHYVVRDVRFWLDIPRWGPIEWRALIEVETNAVLYLRAAVESCTGAVFRDDPITLTGDVTMTPCAPLASLDPLAEVVTLPGLTAADPQPLSGEYVELVDSDPPTVAPPSAALPACEFISAATSDDFSAVNAYYHMDALYRMVSDMGFANYFPGTTFPIPMDHRGESGAVNAHHHGSGSATTKYRFGLAGAACPVGIACDRRVVIHEFGHSVLRNHIDSGVFTFDHGPSDTMAVIMSDPSSQAPDRFDTFPFTNITRRHDRDVAAGWGWGGPNDTGGYSSTQILSTTMFRAYRSIGGDAGELAEREFAARFMTYLILAAVEAETPLTQPSGPEDFAEDVIDADLTTTTFAGHPGGAFHKVIRWAFEKQDAYGGRPPEVDVYIDDGRNGEYPWLSDFTNTPDIWTRYEPDGGSTHQNPLVGTPMSVYARVRNRGTQPAPDVTVRGFSGPTGGGAVWPDQFAPLPTPELPVAGPVPAGGNVIVGPFQWTPGETTKGVSIIMSSSTPRDTSNLNAVNGPVETRRLVPYDNNVSQRDLTVEAYPVQYSVKFICGSAGGGCASSGGGCGPSGGGPVAPGKYFTAINIHNPTDRTIRFRKKVAIALPGERPGHVSAFTFNVLGPDEALEIDCADIYHRVGLPEGCFLKGFVVIHSLVELDVVAVYSAAGADGHVATLDVEYIGPRITKPGKPPDEPPVRLPDLVPLPAFPPASPTSPAQLPQNFCLSTVGGRLANAIRILVRNQGQGDAPASVTRVVFRNNPPVQIPTPAIPAGGDTVVEVMIPQGCAVGESGCTFEITVNATSAFDESNEANNTVNGGCPGIVS
jgi:zinc metalloprotease ZmpB